MKSNFLLIAFILLSSLGYSQQYEISGTVLDGTSGIPLPGVNVVVQKTSLNTTSDIDGNFKISKIPSGSKVVFSYIGYKDFVFFALKN